MASEDLRGSINSQPSVTELRSSVTERPELEAPPHMSIQNDPFSVEAARRHRSLNVVIATMFLASMGFTIFLPLLWFYYAGTTGVAPFPECQGKDQASTAAAQKHCNSMMGFIIGAFPLGQVIGSPIFGYWTQKFAMRGCLILSFFLTMGGYIMYANINSGWLLLVSRLIVGLGAANSAPLRAYASAASNVNDRNVIMAKMSAAQSFGVILGPGVGFLFALSPDFCLGSWCMNRFQLAGYGAVFLTLINLVLFVLYFQELPRESRPSQRSDNGDRLTNNRMDKGAALIMMFEFAIVWFCFSIFEGVGNQMTKRYYHWEEKENAGYMVGLALLSICGFVSIKFLTGGERRLFSDRRLLIVSMAVYTFSLLILVDWGWDVHEIDFWQYCLGCICLSFSFPVATTMTYALFSKVVPKHRQAEMMGWLTMAGSAARCVGPSLAAYGYTHIGYHTYPVYFAAAGFGILGIVLAFIFYPRLVPCDDYSQLKDDEESK